IQVNHDLYDALNGFQNCIRRGENLKSEKDHKQFSIAFENTKNEINKLHINHANTYYQHYKNIASKLEQAINDFLNFQRRGEFKKSLEKINLVITTIEEYKIQIYNRIKK